MLCTNDFRILQLVFHTFLQFLFHIHSINVAAGGGIVCALPVNKNEFGLVYYISKGGYFTKKDVKSLICSNDILLKKITKNRLGHIDQCFAK